MTLVLSVRQPWASLIVLGVKGIENRSWAAPPALIGQRIAIHASANPPALTSWSEIVTGRPLGAEEGLGRLPARWSVTRPLFQQPPTEPDVQVCLHPALRCPCVSHVSPASRHVMPSGISGTERASSVCV